MAVAIRIKSIISALSIFSLLGSALLVSSCSHHNKINTEKLVDGAIKGVTTTRGVTFTSDVVFSYTMLSGEIISNPSDYKKLTWNDSGNVEYYYFDGLEKDARNFLNAESHGVKTSQLVSDVISWTEAQFGLYPNVSFEVLLVPENVDYNYVTSYKNDKSALKFRFGFQYDIETPNPHKKDLVTTLSHEYTHILNYISNFPPSNNISDETFAMLIETCAFSEFFKQISYDHLLPVSDEDVQRLTSGSLSQNIANLKSKSNSDFVIASLIARATLNGVFDRSKRENIEPEQALQKLCRNVIDQNHDFELSLPIELAFQDTE